MKTALTIQNLVKRYGNVEAVRGVSFDVAEGEVFGLLGPNGAGKTTTVECAIGLRHADSGRVEIAGVDVALHPRRAKELFGAQLQTSALQDKITPREALRLFAAFYPRAADVDGMLEQFDLLEKADQAFDTLSIGQRRRLEIAAALIHEPRVLFLDEPTAGMDPLGRREFHGLIARLAQ
ncbi:MAG TPA: ABC transporter ATP-binding protein, partial [Phycisphaerae bacterium]|nr:ABC transporter ATP-binding protein [Phycisphaerae bacterium]